MTDTKKIESWRAEEIAKVFLLNSGLVTLVPQYENAFDFIAISKQAPNKKIAVEVKATKYSEEGVKRIAAKAKNQFLKTGLPILMMYINSDKEDGYFQILRENNEQCQEVQPLQSKQLNEQLSELINN